jgi:bifunctional UDP-N-acetylglucosamine pyrophosphorylase/glucosamine-1-phosphate N-acetyltransferase
MVPVLGRPLVERAVMPFYENGVRDFVFVISPEDTEIEPYFRGRTSLDISARFAVQEERLGTAHALGRAAPLITGKFILSACDSLVDAVHVRRLLKSSESADATLSLLKVDSSLVSRSAVVELEGPRVRRIVEKPQPGEAPSNTVSLPHYVMTPRILELLELVEESSRGEYELQDAIQGLIDGGGRVVGVHASARFQVSSPEDLLLLTRMYLEDPAEPKTVPPELTGRAIEIVQPIHVDEDVVVADGCEIGPEVYLESGCRIGGGAVVRRSIVLRGGEVAEEEIVEDRVVT